MPTYYSLQIIRNSKRENDFTKRSEV